MDFLAQHLTAPPQRHRGHCAHPPCQQNWNGVQGREEESDAGNKACVGGRDDIQIHPPQSNHSAVHLSAKPPAVPKEMEMVQWDTTEDKETLCAYWNNRWT